MVLDTFDLSKNSWDILQNIFFCVVQKKVIRMEQVHFHFGWTVFTKDPIIQHACVWGVFDLHLGTSQQ